jgi:glycosyltransferase involved in cell wall biosynthesis
VNMADNKPLVSIGMPVYNGEKYIGQALDSLLAQDYENFELIISDNASTDGTQEICDEYAMRDKRVRYYRNQQNMGAIWNFDRVFELSNGEYFMWAAADDLWHPTFISRCLSVIEEDPSVVLVYPRTMLIDSRGCSLGLTPDQIDTRGLGPVERYGRVIWYQGWCNMMYGVIRREVLAKTGRFRNIWGFDHVRLAELALRGSFAQIDEPLFYRRDSRSHLEPEMRKRGMLYDLDPMTAAERSKKSTEDLFRELGDAHIQMVIHAPISFLDKLRAAISTVLRFRFRFAQRIVVHFIPEKLRRGIFSWVRRL